MLQLPQSRQSEREQKQSEEGAVYKHAMIGLGLKLHDISIFESSYYIIVVHTTRWVEVSAAEPISS
jgi:hypothetical protein